MNPEKRRPIHPGKILEEHYIRPLGFDAERLAKLLGITKNELYKIRSGDTAITPELAQSLSKLFETTPQLWLNLQNKYDQANEFWQSLQLGLEVDFSKKKVGEALKRELEQGFDITRLARWGDRLHHEIVTGCINAEPFLQDLASELGSMDSDPQFEISEEALHHMADSLIYEGGKEELSVPIPAIKEKAQDLGENWLMCPLCQDAWENYSKYGMVRCPSCDKMLHNPRYSK